MTWRRLPACLCVLPLAVGVVACDSSGRSPPTASTTGHFKPDRDDDNDKNDDDSHVLGYGREAAGAERQTIVSVITHYYRAAAANDGRAGCALLIFFLAESLAEDYGHSRGLRGTTCATVLSKVFGQSHALLLGERASLKFVAIRVGARRALVVMRFANLPEDRQFKLRQEHGRWWLLEARDGILE